MSRTGLPAAFLALCLAAAAAAAAADTEAPCGDLGLRNAYLTQFYCARFAELAALPGATRGMEDASPAEGDGAAPLPWDDIPIIRDAYRADPRKTLALIERIRNAGGLGDQ